MRTYILGCDNAFKLFNLEVNIKCEAKPVRATDDTPTKTGLTFFPDKRGNRFLILLKEMGILQKLELQEF